MDWGIYAAPKQACLGTRTGGGGLMAGLGHWWMVKKEAQQLQWPGESGGFGISWSDEVIKEEEPAAYLKVGWKGHFGAGRAEEQGR